MKLLFLTISIYFFFILSYAQNLTSEFGTFIGGTSMQTDYGERGHFNSSFGNIGFGIGGAYYVSFNNYRTMWNERTTYLKEHLRLRIELSFMKTNLIHRGKYTQGNSEFSRKYNAMRGTSNILNYGTQIEYSIFNLLNKNKINPYISIGILGNTNSPKLTSTLGDINPTTNLIPTVYNNGVFLTKKKSIALTLGAGTRIKSKNNNFLIDFRWQYFNSDTIEGLSPNINANKSNDWLIFISFGYIINFNKRF